MTGEATVKSPSTCRWALTGGAGMVILAIVCLRLGVGLPRPLLGLLGAAGILACCWGLTTLLRIQASTASGGDSSINTARPAPAPSSSPQAMPPVETRPADERRIVDQAPARSRRQETPSSPEPSSSPAPSPQRPSPSLSSPPAQPTPAPTAPPPSAGLIQFQCHCGQRIAAPAKLAGQVVPCPSCKRPGRIPASSVDGGR